VERNHILGVKHPKIASMILWMTFTVPTYVGLCNWAALKGSGAEPIFLLQGLIGFCPGTRQVPGKCSGMVYILELYKGF
jgi:hypothetical protein